MTASKDVQRFLEPSWLLERITKHQQKAKQMFILAFLAEHEKIIKQIFWIVLLCAFAIAFWKNVLLFVCAVSASVFTAEFISKELGVLIFIFYCLYVFFGFFKKHFYD